MVLPSVMFMRAFWNIQANVRQYYQQFEEQQTQSLIDQKVKEHLGQTTAAALAQQQVAGAVYSHLTTLGGQYKPIAAPGLRRPPALTSARPPVLAPPGPSGYGSGAPPTFRSPVALPLGSASTQYYSSNGPAQLQLTTSNGAPQYSVNNNSSLSQSYSSSSLGAQSQHTLGINSLPAQYQSSSGDSQEQQYSNGPARVSLPPTFNQGPVYQR